jgi:hypothetical protein
MSIVATLISGYSVSASESNRFVGVEISIPVLSHDYYLGEGSGATHYWHGENRDTQFIKTGGSYAVTEDPTGTVHPDLLAHSKKMDKGIFVIKDCEFNRWTQHMR